MGAVGAAPSPAPGGGRRRNPDSGLNHSVLEKQVQEGRRRSLDQKKKKKKSFLVGFSPRDRVVENKTSRPEKKKTNQTNTNIPRLKAYLSPLSPTITVRLPRRSRVRAAINA